MVSTDAVADAAGDSPDSADASDGLAPSALVVVADTNRDGEVDADDRAGRADWSWQRGAFFLANVDDDDEDGAADASDEVVNGPADASDLASVRIELGSAAAAAAAAIHVSIPTGTDHVRLFRAVEDGFEPIEGALSVEPSLRLGIESLRFAGPDWDGQVRLRVEARDAGGGVVAEDEVAMRVAPWIMTPSSAPPVSVHVAAGAYSNESFLDDLEAAVATAGVDLRTPHATAHWQEMWMQDTMEIGYSQLPGGKPMHVVLRANRGKDSYPATLLGPDMGFLVVGATRSTPGGDAWVDWYGNLEVSPPVPGWPLGRIYYGHNTASGMRLHPDVVAFLEAQQIQAPFWIDTSWLTIKHVDEILTFVPASDGTPRMLLVSPRAAGELYPPYYGSYNQGIQAKIDKAIHGGSYVVDGVTIDYQGVLSLLNLAEESVVEVPLFYTDGHADWSNPINGLYLGNGFYAAGETDIWQPERELTEARLDAIGVQVLWIDDAAYQYNLGNVHCATNATRTPAVADFSTALPAGL